MLQSQIFDIFLESSGNLRIPDIVATIAPKKNGNICDNVEKYIVEKLSTKKALTNMVRKLTPKTPMEIRNKVPLNCF